MVSKILLLLIWHPVSREHGLEVTESPRDTGDVAEVFHNFDLPPSFLCFKALGLGNQRTRGQLQGSDFPDALLGVLPKVSCGTCPSPSHLLHLHLPGMFKPILKGDWGEGIGGISFLGLPSMG